MGITFRRNSVKTVKNNTRLFKLKIEQHYNQFFDSRQASKIFKEIMESGYVETENEINGKILNEYKQFKLRFPNYSFKKQDLEQAREIIKDIKHDDYVYSAENIFYKIKELLPGLADSTVYYWFEKVGSKFSTIKSYNKDVTTLVIYQAVKRKENLST